MISHGYSQEANKVQKTIAAIKFFSNKKGIETFSVFLLSFRITLLAFYQEWLSLIGYAIHYLFCCG